MRYAFADGTVDVHEAWTTAQVKSTIEQILGDWGHALPADHDARIVIKPNLNNDLVALTGNCADLRVLCSLIEGLQNRGYRNLCVADGSNVGMARRGIDGFKRLRIGTLGERYGVDIVDLNHDDGTPMVLQAGAMPVVADTVVKADFLISVPKIKTHAEAGVSCAMKNWVGICRGQAKRHMHYDLAHNIFAINEAVLPNLIIVDGLVGMEGNGPGDGEPFRFGYLLASDSAFVNDVVVCRLVDYPLDDVGYLVHARQAGYVSDELVSQVAETVPVLRPIKRAPVRSKLAELSEAKSLHWLKLAVRPALNNPVVLEGAYKLKIIQDVYALDDDTLRLVGRKEEACGDCKRCEDFCPTHLSKDEIGVKTDAEDCIQCLYCWWVCPEDALEVDGALNHLERQVDRYKAVIEHI